MDWDMIEGLGAERITHGDSHGPIAVNSWVFLVLSNFVEESKLTALKAAC